MVKRICWLMGILACSPVIDAATMLAPGIAPPGAKVEVDRRIVLTIGPLELSAYAVEKNVNRFRGTGGRRPARSVEEVRDWFRLFLAQQVVIAKAQEEGYLERPEVMAMVDRMAAHMLTQTEGPFYETLYGREPTREELAALYARTAEVRDAVVARFRDAKEMDAALGEDFRVQPPEEKLARLARLGERDSAAVREGALTWPYDPFAEIGDALEKLQAGEWLDGEPGLEGYYVAHVRTVEQRTLPDFATAADNFSRFARMAQKFRVQRERRARLLREAEFAFDREIAERLVAGLRAKRASETGGISSEAVAEIADDALFSFAIAGERRVVSVAEFATHFNQRFVRRLTLEIDAIEGNAREMAMVALDLIEAKARGIDREPQFAEDRKNFLNYQALDWFEKERLLPDIEIAEQAVAERYAASVARFTQPVEVRVQRLVFPDVAAAQEFRARQRPAETGATELPAGAATSEVSVTREAPIAALEFITEMLLRGEPGATFGPFKVAEGAVVLVRGATLRTETEPLAAAAPGLRRELERAALDAREIALARALASSFAIEDRIDYARYGFADGVEAPWSK
jgi:hypothetical protein